MDDYNFLRWRSEQHCYICASPMGSHATGCPAKFDADRERIQAAADRRAKRNAKHKEKNNGNA